jgi:hypothetical protein
MQRYLLSIYQPEGPPPTSDALARIMGDVAAVREQMKAAGAWLMAAGLEPPATACVLRARGERVLTTDGPFTESKEYLGGFTLIQAPDRAAALEWGRRLARATTLPVEVRACREEAQA